MLAATCSTSSTPAGNLSDSGSISFSDVDLSDVHLVSATGTPIGTTLGTLTAVKDSDTTGTGSGGQLTWTYMVAAAAVEDLAAGETKLESFTITLDDQNGGQITKQIDVTITGTNDAPVIAVGVGDSAAATLANNGGDAIYGGSGNDTINGGNGTDIIVGGWGADILAGGSGNDTFKFLGTTDSPAGIGNYGTITDFDSGNDKLDFSAINGITTIQGATTGTILNAHSIAWIINSTDNTIDVYANDTSSAETIGGSGVTAPNMQIHLTNVTSLSSIHDIVF